MAAWGRLRLQHPRAPLWLLGVVSVVSLGMRVFNLDKPYDADTGRGSLIFDEQYYVNAARVILGIHPPAGANYAGAALFHDPNAEHPPLGKIIISDTIRVFGDNPWGWRIGPVIFGTVAILAIFWLVRSARGSAWLALGAATLMAADNLMMVHARIATLDIFLVTFMLVAVAAYLRGRLMLAGLALAFGLATKLLALDVIFVLALFELGEVIRRRPGAIGSRFAALRSRLVPLLTFSGIGVMGYMALLFFLDLIVAPIGGPGSCPTTPSGFHNPILHSEFMLCYAGKLTSPNGPEGIASYPWQWLLNDKPIDYFTLSNNVFSGGKQVATHVVISFRGEMNPALILLAFPGSDQLSTEIKGKDNSNEQKHKVFWVKPCASTTSSSTTSTLSNSSSTTTSSSSNSSTSSGGQRGTTTTTTTVTTTDAGSVGGASTSVTSSGGSSTGGGNGNGNGTPNTGGPGAAVGGVFGVATTPNTGAAIPFGLGSLLALVGFGALRARRRSNDS